MGDKFVSGLASERVNGFNPQTRKPANPQTQEGFTLVELIVVAAILCIIGLVIMSTFSGGLNVYYRMRGYSTVKADVLLVLEKMDRDIRNTFAFKDIDFVGTSKKMTFPALIRSHGAKDTPYMSVGSVSYFIDDRSNNKKLAREEKDYHASSMKKEAAKGAVTGIAAIEDLNFEYYSYDPVNKAYSWESSWDKTEEKKELKEKKALKPAALLKDRPEEIPLGVKVEISYNDGGRTHMLNRAIFIDPAVSLNLAKMMAAEISENAKKNEP